MTTRRAVRFAVPALSLAALSLGALAGCYSPGGPGYSGLAPLTYHSTEMSPKTVSLIDKRTGETVWSVDVPVNQQLVIRFRENMNEGSFMPDTMLWRVMEKGRWTGNLDNEIPAPPRYARRVDMTLRSRPELPESSLSQSPVTMDQ